MSVQQVDNRCKLGKNYLFKKLTNCFYSSNLLLFVITYITKSFNLS